MTLNPASSSTSAPESDDLEMTSRVFLADLQEKDRLAILAEARRKRARLSSIPWYAEAEKKDGAEFWLRLSRSYMGEA